VQENVEVGWKEWIQIDEAALREIGVVVLRVFQLRVLPERLTMGAKKLAEFNGCGDANKRSPLPGSGLPAGYG
jgi:hypothetical protein